MLSFLGFAKIRKRELIKSEQGEVEIPLLFQHMISSQQWTLASWFIFAKSEVSTSSEGKTLILSGAGNNLPNAASIPKASDTTSVE